MRLACPFNASCLQLGRYELQKLHGHHAFASIFAIQGSKKFSI